MPTVPRKRLMPWLTLALIAACVWVTGEVWGRATPEQGANIGAGLLQLVAIGMIAIALIGLVISLVK